MLSSLNITHTIITMSIISRILLVIFYDFFFYYYRSIVLDYKVNIRNLRDEDQIFQGGSLGNYSLAGFEMILERHVSHYIINYYLPSGLFVVVSWISFLVPAEIIPGICHFISRKICELFSLTINAKLSNFFRKFLDLFSWKLIKNDKISGKF